MENLSNIQITCTSLESSDPLFQAQMANLKQLVDTSWSNGTLLSLVDTMNDANFLKDLDVLQLFVFCRDIQQRIHQNYINTSKTTLIKYVYPFLFTFGILGNLLCLTVTIRRIRSPSAFNRKLSLCLTMLCFADMAIILFGCLREYIDEMFDTSIRSWSIHLCRFLYFVCYLFSAYSSYLYAFIAWERWYAISDPIRHKQNQSNRNKVPIFLLLAYCVVISMPFLYYPALNKAVLDHHQHKETLNVEIETRCEIASSGNVPLTLLDAIFFCFVPFLISLVFSLLALIQLVRRNRLKNAAMTVKKTSTCAKPTKNMAPHSNFDFIKYEKTPCSLMDAHSKHIKSNAQHSCESARVTKHVTDMTINNIKKPSNFKLTLMLMSFSICYLVATFPIFLIISFKLAKHYLRADDTTNYQVPFVFAKMIMYINYSINILLFVLFGKSLRKDFLEIFTVRRTKKR